MGKTIKEQFKAKGWEYDDNLTPGENRWNHKQKEFHDRLTKHRYDDFLELMEWLTYAKWNLNTHIGEVRLFLVKDPAKLETIKSAFKKANEIFKNWSDIEVEEWYVPKKQAFMPIYKIIEPYQVSHQVSVFNDHFDDFDYLKEWDNYIGHPVINYFCTPCTKASNYYDGMWSNKKCVWILMSADKTGDKNE